MVFPQNYICDQRASTMQRACWKNPNLIGEKLKKERCLSLTLTANSKLSFTEHVEKVCKKLASRITVLSKIRGFLPLNQCLQYYNAVIRPVMSFSIVIWSECDKDLLNRIIRLQKRAARVILFADRLVSSVSLFNKLSWIPFYEQCKIHKCSILYKRINGILPNYLNEHIVISNNTLGTLGIQILM